jgi:hypothetical protein
VKFPSYFHLILYLFHSPFVKLYYQHSLSLYYWVHVLLLKRINSGFHGHGFKPLRIERL